MASWRALGLVMRLGSDSKSSGTPMVKIGAGVGAAQACDLAIAKLFGGSVVMVGPLCLTTLDLQIQSVCIPQVMGLDLLHAVLGVLEMPSPAPWEEPASVQQQILTATVKMFLKVPQASRATTQDGCIQKLLGPCRTENVSLLKPHDL